jgi:hypothetical protein
MSRKPWYIANNDLFLILQKEVEKAYPQLGFLIRNGTVFLSGNFLLRDDGKVVDSFLIEIEFPFNFPKRIPVVYEIGNRIPKIADRHMYRDGRACLYLPFQLSEIFPEGSGLLDFLNGPVLSFFVSQSYYELTGEWPFGEWPHGPDAIIEYYGSVLGTSNKNLIINYLQVISKKEIKGHWLCPCGSGKILRDCHYTLVKKLHHDFQYAMVKTGSNGKG